jgi:hypothetical protein
LDSGVQIQTSSLLTKMCLFFFFFFFFFENKYNARPFTWGKKKERLFRESLESTRDPSCIKSVVFGTTRARFSLVF